MTIGKKLYAGFGLILAIFCVLMMVNIISGLVAKSARNNAGMALDSKTTIESVRNQIMMNRLNMIWLRTDSMRSEEHTSELQSRRDLVCRLLLEKKKQIKNVSRL